MPAGRTHNTRAIALALALGVNGLLLALLLSSHDAPPPVQKNAATAMLWFALPPPPSPPPRSLPRNPPATRNDVRSDVAVQDPSPLAPPPAVVQQSAPGTSIDISQIDWTAAAAKATQDMLRRQEQAAKNPLKSDPEVMVMPKNRGDADARVERFEGGVAMHVDGDCVITTNPQAMQAWSLDPVEKAMGGPASARWSAKSGGCRADQTSRHRAEALEKAVKPRYLGGQRPPPEEGDSTSAIKIP